MAIVHCRECKREVSSEATACPHCGVPRQVNQASGCAVLIVACVAIGGITLLIKQCDGAETSESPAVTADPSPGPVSSNTESTAASPSPAEQARSATLNAGALAVEFLRRNMRNPDSFSLDDATLLDSGTFCFTYRGQNGFGGMNVEHAVMNEKSSTFEAEGQPDFETAWRHHCAGKPGEDVTDEIQSRAEFARRIMPKIKP
jgi:hypothetical protein